MLLALVSLFFSEPVPLEMPRAEAYLVQKDGEYSLEDRYNVLDLWTSRTVEGYWQDGDGRTFMLARLEWLPPAVDTDESVTRRRYSAGQSPISRKNFRQLRNAISGLTGFELPEKGVPPRHRIRGYADIDYWQGTNSQTVACAFLPEKTETWYLAVWNLLPEDDAGDCVRTFEEDFLGRDFPDFRSRRPVEKVDWQTLSEREQLRHDAHHSITNFSRWHWTDSEEFTVLDDLPRHRSFVQVLTNDLAVMRRRFASVLPTPVSVSNSLSVARIFADRAEYLSVVDESVAWTSAYWSPVRRELVAHLEDDGDEDRLLRTLRHESFHQYLSYASSMISVSPWLNEGYAQYFEDETSRDWGARFHIDRDALERLAKYLPNLFRYDYERFYDDSGDLRYVNYRLAWSVAVFLEHGARKVRFDPFKDLKSRYFNELLKSHDMHSATAAAFGSDDRLRLFVSEWVKFWSNR